MWPSQFGRKLVLGTRRRWSRPKRDIGTARGRLCLLFGCTLVLSVLVLNIVHFSSTYAVTAGFAVFANDSWTRSVLWLTQSIIDVARILSEVHFPSPKKLTTFLQSSRSKHTLKLPKYLLPPPKSPPLSSKIRLLLCLGDALSAWRVHLQISSVNMAPNFFLNPGGCTCTSAPAPGYAYAVNIIWVQ